MFERWLELYKAALTGFASKDGHTSDSALNNAKYVADKALETVNAKEAEMANKGYREPWAT